MAFPGSCLPYKDDIPFFLDICSFGHLPYESPVKGAGLASHQFQVMLGIELPFVVAEEPFVARYFSAVMEDVDPVDGQLDPHLQPDIRDRYGVVVLVDNDCRVFIDLRFKKANIDKRHGGKRDKTFFFSFKETVDILRAPGDPVGAMLEAGAQQVLVELLEALNDRHGNEEVAPYISDHAFHPALLIGGSRVAEAGLKIIV